ncbi:MAG: ribonuclease Z [Candidatus Aenigmatarchaeota archaeon]
MIEITFLGTVSGIPSKERNHPAIALEYYSKKKETLLFDCGEGTQKQLMIAGISFMKIHKVFITHWHADHFAGLIPLLQTMSLEKRKNELKIFAPEAEKFVANILSLGYFGCRFSVIPINVPFHGDKITLVDETEDYQVFSVPTFHSVPSVAYAFKEKDRWSVDPEKIKKFKLGRGRWLEKLKKYGRAEYKGREVKIEEVANLKKGLKVVYSGDTRPCDTIVKVSEGADLLIHDGTFLEEESSKAHADVKQAARIAKKAGVKQLILTHISRRYTDVKELEESAKKIFENTKVAYDFMKVVLK